MIGGLLLIDKPSGVTSRYVDNRIQHLFSSKKVGHLGTLDPFATGLLVLGVNNGTKYLNYLDGGEKSYTAELKLGYSSSTGDPEGEISEAKSPDRLEVSDIEKALASFIGPSSQIPPMAAAIKVNGVPLYKMMRKGEEIPRAPRAIDVFSIQLLSYEKGIVRFSCRVSAGTYIRVLGEDIAKKLGTEGYLVSLRRTGVGPIKVEEATPFEQINVMSLKAPEAFLTSMPKVELNEEENKLAHYGCQIAFPGHQEEKLFLIYEGQGVAVYAKKGEGYVSERGLF